MRKIDGDHLTRALNVIIKINEHFLDKCTNPDYISGQNEALRNVVEMISDGDYDVEEES